MCYNISTMGKLRRAGIIVRVALASLVLFTFSSATQAADLDDLYRQREQLNQELEKSQSAAANKSNEVKTLEKQISSLESDISSTEQKIGGTSKDIELTQTILDNLSKDIEVKKQALARLKASLDAALVEIYRFSARSDLELLFSGDSLGESTNQQEYIEAVEIQVKQVHQQVTTAKGDLEKRKSDQEAEKARLDDLKNQQESYKKGIEYQKGQKGKLLGMTVEQKKAYEEQAEKIRQEVAQVSGEIYRKRQAAGGGENLGGGSGYNYSCGMVDDWGFYTCQCTSYAAWYWNVVLGKRWERGDGPSGTGDAKNWPSLAARNGVSIHSTPTIGAIISWPGDDVYIPTQYGHVAIVEAVFSDGTLDISEYNWIPLSFSRRHINPGKYGSYSYIY